MFCATVSLELGTFAKPTFLPKRAKADSRIQKLWKSKKIDTWTLELLN